MIVIMCDGSSKGNPGPATIGVVAWNRVNNPRIITPNYRRTTDIGVRTNMEAEWEAILASMRYAIHSNNKQEVHIFSDAQTVVKQANGIWNVKHGNIKPLFKTYLELKDLLPNLSISWVPRQLVYLADKAANQKGRKE